MVRLYRLLSTFSLLPLLTTALPPSDPHTLLFDNSNTVNPSESCTNFETCSTLGIVLWRKLQLTISRPSPQDRTDGKPIFDKYYNTDIVPLANYGENIRADLQRHDIDLQRMTLYASASQNPTTGEKAMEPAYGNIIDVDQGVIIGIQNHNGFDNERKLNLSEILYQTWRRAMRSRADKNLSRLRYSIQPRVDNEAAQALITMAYKKVGYPPVGRDKKGDAVWRKWTAKDTPKWFFALLGTDNCKTTMFLLDQHAAEVGKKVVTEIWTRWKGDGLPDIWMNIGKNGRAFTSS
ncbi:MAG: hypothetical protein Q9182_006879 [Xanthomendoza sp. 2 TL-2023]